MCGLTGVIKHNMSLGYYQKFKDLMVLAQLRGDDGAGIMSVPKGEWEKEIKHVNVKRSTWSSGHLITLSDYDDLLKGDRSALIGHARQPTKGASTIENVHPHRSEHIILMHNGTMSHVGNEQIQQGKSDSRMIAKYLVSHTPQEFVQNSYGAYCLVWVDMNKQTINFLRNGERPLWFCEEKFTSMEGSNTDALFWASEASFMQLVLSRYHGYAKERMKYYMLPKDEHWEFPLNLPLLVPEPVIRECKKIIKVNHYDHQHHGYDGYGGYGAYGTWEDQVPEKVSPPFEPRVGLSTNVSLPAIINKETAHNSTPFTYIPPEHRAKSGGDVSRSIALDASRSISLLVDNSKRLALENAQKADAAVINKSNQKGDRSEKSAIFPEKKIADFACTDIKRVRSLVSTTACVWCSERPLFEKGSTPTIYPVRFSDTRRDYVCAECIGDTDIQRAFGFG